MSHSKNRTHLLPHRTRAVAPPPAVASSSPRGDGDGVCIRCAVRVAYEALQRTMADHSTILARLCSLLKTGYAVLTLVNADFNVETPRSRE